MLLILIFLMKKVDVELLVDGYPYPGMVSATIFSNNEVIKIIGLAIIRILNMYYYV